MPEGTTRLARWLHRRAKYAYRGLQIEKSRPRTNTGGSSADGGTRLGPTWYFITDGRRQAALDLKYAKHRRDIGVPPYSPPPHYHITRDGEHGVPHIHYEFTDHEISHAKEDFTGFQLRRITYRGHKFPRLNGQGRAEWKAYRYARIYFRLWGVFAWPAWDPAGRMPVRELTDPP